jgi:hypothetical protein
VQAEVQAGGSAGGGEELTVVDIQNARVYLDAGMKGSQLSGGDPVGGGPQAVEEAGGGQRERARADGGDARAVGGGCPQGIADGRG